MNCALSLVSHAESDTQDVTHSYQRRLDPLEGRLLKSQLLPDI